MVDRARLDWQSMELDTVPVGRSRIQDSSARGFVQAIAVSKAKADVFIACNVEQECNRRFECEDQACSVSCPPMSLRQISFRHRVLFQKN